MISRGVQKSLVILLLSLNLLNCQTGKVSSSTSLVIGKNQSSLTFSKKKTHSFRFYLSVEFNHNGNELTRSVLIKRQIGLTPIVGTDPNTSPSVDVTPVVTPPDDTTTSTPSPSPITPATPQVPTSKLFWIQL